MAIVSIELPLSIYERLQQEAEQSSRSIEEVLVENLALLSGESIMELTVQDSFSDEKLWAIVHQKPNGIRQKRIRDLIAKGKQRPLSDDESAELDSLVDLADHLVLLRSQALLLLKQRGHNINAYIKQA
jgi:hypothetical protein